MELWTAFVLGLVGSLHCAGMCGPLALAIPIPPGGTGRFVLGRLLYNTGRLATYCVLGLIFGLAGRTLLLAGVQRWLSITLGLLLLLGVFASRRLALAAPITRLVGKLKQAMGHWLQARSLGALPILGALTGLLPCGLVYVACAGAAATGTLLGGIAYMAVFGIGTVPMLLAIGLSGRLVPLNWRRTMVRAVPWMVCLLGGLLVLRGLSLGIPYVSPDLTAPSGHSCCH
jgi:sulfite exporter TauE/SafE